MALEGLSSAALQIIPKPSRARRKKCRCLNNSGNGGMTGRAFVGETRPKTARRNYFLR